MFFISTNYESFEYISMQYDWKNFLLKYKKLINLMNERWKMACVPSIMYHTTKDDGINFEIT